MRFLLTLILLLPFGLNAATQFTEFYVKSTGNVLNGGSDTNDAPKCFLAGGFWTNATGVFRKDSSTFTNVAVGDFASVYPDGGGTNVFTACVTNVTSTNIWLSLVSKTGTSPGDDTAGATSIRVGGAWSGPNTNSTSITNNIFPFNFVAYTMTNAPNVFPRVNFYNDLVYRITNGCTHASAGPVRFQGMTSTPGDGGKCSISGPATGTSFRLLDLTGANIDLQDMVLSNNGNAGTSSAILGSSGNNNHIYRVVVSGARRSGFNVTAADLWECEAFGCNTENASSHGGFTLAANVKLIRCISRDNTGANSWGFGGGTANYLALTDCISYGNGGNGLSASGANVSVKGCDFYNNGGSGIDMLLASASSIIVENCNFFKNGKGIASSGSQLRSGLVVNCAFGSGSNTNTSGNLSPLGGIEEIGTITYTPDSTPWNDEVNGNFTISATSSVKSAGRGMFTQLTINSPTNTVSFPDIGAAQSASTNAAAVGGGSYTFAQ